MTGADYILYKLVPALKRTTYRTKWFQSIFQSRTGNRVTPFLDGAGGDLFEHRAGKIVATTDKNRSTATCKEIKKNTNRSDDDHVIKLTYSGWQEYAHHRLDFQAACKIADR